MSARAGRPRRAVGAAARARTSRSVALAGLSLLSLFVLACGSPAAAACTWLEVGDGQLRSDLVLLADGGVIDLPLLEWPVPVADARRALAAAHIERARREGERQALERVRRTVDAASCAAGSRTGSVRVSAGEPALLRDFDTPAREEGEIGVRTSAAAGRWSATLQVTGALSPADGQPLRLDGSQVTAQLGNWLLTAGLPDRWWGPGYESSLILSNNARPMPQLSLQRASSEAFRTPWLRWIGPWRLTALVAAMEQHRPDVDHPLFFGMRLSARPHRVLEVGLSRSAQFCGEGRRCTLEVVKNMLFGNDTVGASVSARDEPGNQLAGYDFRLSSPWRVLPLAGYWQIIGEDRISNRPTKRLELAGVEAWHASDSGLALRAYVEVSNTTCSGYGSAPVFNCAYTNANFREEGYRYRGRVIGHTTESDSDAWAAGLRVTLPGGSEWRVRARDARLNRDSLPDPASTLIPRPLKYRSVEAAWKGTWLGGELDIGLGGERTSSGGGPAGTHGFGFASWRKSFGEAR